MPVVSPGKSGESARPNPKRRTYSPSRSGTERQPDLDGADVARLHHHVGERQRPVVVRVVDDARSEPDFSAGDVDDVVDADHVLFERRARGHDLERRSGLVDVLHGAVAPMLGRCARERVRIERRLVGQRENLAGLRRHDQHRAAGGAVARDRIAQLALGDVLQVLVDRQLDGRAGRRRTLEPAEGAAARVGLIEQLAERAADLAVVGGLDAGEPFVVDADESQQLRGELLLRIEAAVFLDEPDAFEVELGDRAAPACGVTRRRT